MERIRSRMHASECQQRIVALVREHGRVEVPSPAEDFGVAHETVRRDLSALGPDGLLRRAAHRPAKVCTSGSSARVATLTIRSLSAAAMSSAEHATTAAPSLGGFSEMPLSDPLGRPATEVASVPVDRETRISLNAVESDGVLTKINAPGPELTAHESDVLLKTVRGLIGPDTNRPTCRGSLPRGLAPERYADLMARAHDCGARISLDTSGSALLAALRIRPDAAEPKREERAEAVGRPLASIGDAMEAAAELRALSARQAPASLGGDGMLLVPQEGGWYASAPVSGVSSDVGAGDASLTGFLGAGGAGPKAPAAAAAHGAAAVQLQGSAVPTPADLDSAAVTVTADIPLDRPLDGRNVRPGIGDVSHPYRSKSEEQ